MMEASKGMPYRPVCLGNLGKAGKNQTRSHIYPMFGQSINQTPPPPPPTICMQWLSCTAAVFHVCIQITPLTPHKYNKYIYFLSWKITTPPTSPPTMPPISSASCMEICVNANIRATEIGMRVESTAISAWMVCLLY
jgi:hypothetical protein